MRILSINHELLYKTDRLTITFDIKDRMQLIEKLKALGSVDPEKEYDITIERHREKRSRDANAYMWILCDKIADKTQTTKEDIYREAIRRSGVFRDIAITNEAADWLIESWEKNGIGWFADDFDSTLKGCRRVRLYSGSSTYNTKEMSRLIDDIVQEAKDLDIETATPDELSKMKEVWGAE